MKPLIFLFITLFSLSSFLWLRQSAKPTIYLIGDSTVKNGSGKGEGSLWGWGDFLHEQLDTHKVSIKNHALGGRSSRSFQTQGLWDKVLVKLKPGDFVLMQFGHNDNGSLNTGRARGTLKGTGEETETVVMDTITGNTEVVHTYGWYMRKYIRETKAKGAVPVMFSLVPRNIWKDGKIDRVANGHAQWAAEIAQQEGIAFVDLHEQVSVKYETFGQDKVKSAFFVEDHTHTNQAGAQLNAQVVAEGLRSIKKSPFKKFFLSKK